MLSDGGTATAHIAYRLSDDGHVYRVAAAANATPEDVSALLAGSSGNDTAVGLSRDGLWLGILTTRFDCGSWSCLALVATSPTGATASTGTLITYVDDNGATQPIHNEGRPAVAKGAAFVVYSAEGGSHTRDLFIAKRSAAAGDALLFDKPYALTTHSTFATHDLPALDATETHVVADCAGSNGANVSLCSVDLTGSGTVTTLATVDPPPSGSAGPSTEVHSGDFLPDGTMVFESDWDAEQIWRRAADGTLSRVAPSFTNDNSPCALPDGHVASLWLERPGNPMGYHELKVMDLQGDYEMVVIGKDVDDIGLGCGL